MISRRKFVLSSLAASAATLSARASSASTPSELQAGRAVLKLHFVGGTVFRRVFDEKKKLVRITAVQLSGKDINGDPFKHQSYPYEMPHRSYIVLPSKTVPNVDPFPDKYDTKSLHADLTDPRAWQPICLVGKDVTIDQQNGGTLAYKCGKVAGHKDYMNGHTWTPLGHWQDHNAKLEPMVNSRFNITSGVLDDGTPQDRHASGRLWAVGNKDWKSLSDVAILTIEADEIAIKGVYGGSITVGSGKELKAYVFSGPDTRIGREKYYWINHALLVHTLYTITPEPELRPWTDEPVDPMTSTGVMKHPCDLADYQPRGEGALSPPDSEYCTNYDDMP
jgi:hypothetical protein